MDHIANGPQVNPTQRKKAADYVYQAATLAAALLVLLTATV